MAQNHIVEVEKHIANLAMELSKILNHFITLKLEVERLNIYIQNSLVNEKGQELAINKFKELSVIYYNMKQIYKQVEIHNNILNKLNDSSGFWKNAIEYDTYIKNNNKYQCKVVEIDYKIDDVVAPLQIDVINELHELKIIRAKINEEYITGTNIINRITQIITDATNLRNASANKLRIIEISIVTNLFAGIPVVPVVPVQGQAPVPVPVQVPVQVPVPVPVPVPVQVPVQVKV